MKIVAKKKDLIQHLSVVEKAMPRNSLVPSAVGVLVEAKDALTFTATNLSISIKADAVEADIWEEGSLVLPPKFVDLVRVLPGEMVSMQPVEQREKETKLHIKSGEGEFTLYGRNSEDFPQVLSDAKQWEQVSFPGNKFKNILRKTLFAAVQDQESELSPVFRGLNIKANNDEILFIASDTFRLARMKVKIESEEFEDFSIIVPVKSLELLEKIIVDEDDVVCHFNKKDFRVKYKNYMFGTQLLVNGEYPNFDSIFPDSSQEQITVNSKELRDTIIRALLINEKNNVVYLSAQDKLSVRTVSEIGDMNEKLEITKTGEGFDAICLNGSFLLDPLKIIPNKEIKIEFNGPYGPVVINENEYQYLLLPIKVEKRDTE